VVGEQGLVSSLNLTRFVGAAGELGKLAGRLGGGVAVWPIGWIPGGRVGWPVPVTTDTGTLGCGPASGMAAGAAG